MGQGWICLHRKIRECDLIWDDKPFSRGQAWIDLLIQVNHEDKEIMFNARSLTVKRGQKITSIRNLGEQWGWSRTKVKLFLNELKKAGMIDYFSDTKKTLVTVLNYGLYQGQDKEKEPQKSHKKATKKPQKDTNNNDNNVNNDNNINPPLPPKGNDDTPEYDLRKHSNVENTKHFLNAKEYPHWEYIKANARLWECIKTWMSYKDERPKRNGHYNTETGIQKLLTQFVEYDKQYGTDEIIRVVDDSIAAEYVGIVWGWLGKKKPDNANTGVASIRIED